MESIASNAIMIAVTSPSATRVFRSPSTCLCSASERCSAICVANARTVSAPKGDVVSALQAIASFF